jgi:plasmid replication initiation protein
MKLTKENNIPKLFNSKTAKIYKNKKLNSANFGNFTHNDYQVYLHLVSKVGGVDAYGKYLQPELLEREHTITATEFSQLFNVSLANCYLILKQAVDKLMKTDIKVEKGELKEIWRINVCSMAKYNKHQGSITIQFTDSIMPYLAQVRQRFVLYNLKEIANFGSLYTTRLYELIQEFKETGWMHKTIYELREAFAIGEKFKAYRDFKQRTFAHACQEINANYHINLRFEEEKEGRKVVAVKFFFKPTIIIQVTNQKTGKSTNIYKKPKAKIDIGKKVNKDNLTKLPDVLEDQLSFANLKEEPKTIKSILSSMFSKFMSSKK